MVSHQSVSVPPPGLWCSFLDFRPFHFPVVPGKSVSVPVFKSCSGRFKRNIFNKISISLDAHAFPFQRLIGTGRHPSYFHLPVIRLMHSSSGSELLSSAWLFHWSWAVHEKPRNTIVAPRGTVYIYISYLRLRPVVSEPLRFANHKKSALSILLTLKP